MASAQYWIEIQNEYLGKYRRVTGRSRREVELKASEQLQRWAEQEQRARQREAVADAKQGAVEATDQARALLEDYRSILHATLAVDDRLNWEILARREEFSQPTPSLDAFTTDVPRRRPVLEWLRLASTEDRVRLEKEAADKHMNAVTAWERRKRAHDQRQDQERAEIEAFRASYEEGDNESIERYVSLVLASSAFPTGFPRNCEVGYDGNEREIIVDVDLIVPDDLPTTTEVRYVASRDEFTEKHLKPREIADLYDDVILQTLLRTIHEIFEGDYADHCQAVTFNGMVTAVDKATGKDYDACIISCRATRQEFLEIDLARVDPRSCFRALKGLSGTALIGLEPVQPIRVLNKDDPRFIEAAEVLDGLAADQNLMTMDWQDFEVLVRDLFNQMFASNGSETKVTRSSRDEGVDAVIFDPDPVTGGKLIVQAKRYRNAVPVAAVRELYGTMINEGAAKGILVTTSHFGAGARDFAKDKPLTLLDGANLLHYLQNHGHRVRIDLTAG